eukprot:394543_1
MDGLLQWTCNICTFLNHLDTAACSMCNNPRPQEQYQSLLQFREESRREKVTQPQKEERTALLIIGYLSFIKKRDLFSDCVADIVYDYYLLKNEWDENKKGSRMKVNGKSVKMMKNDRWSSCYGKEICRDGGIYEWELKYKKNKASADHLMFGIAGKNSTWMESHANQADCWLFCSTNYANCVYGDGDGISDNYAPPISDNSVIEMKLNLIQYTLSFSINDKDYGIAVSDLPKNKEYNLIVSMAYTGQELILEE